MIEDIIETARAADFDFRKSANPSDPLRNLFEEWVPYYRLKYAVAKTLQPTSVLEIGVRFGYSAVAFLAAAPAARFVGIDLNAESFGGHVDPFQWAKQITSIYDAQFIVADTQQMERLPGGVYDLIHVNGQQDGFGTFHDLRKAIAQARWVLLDGYFWTRENHTNANDFLMKYKDVLEYVLAIPGYAGELLLRVKDDYVGSNGAAATGPVESAQLTQFYDSSYYLTDCGGYREFRQSGGQQVEDPRLLSLLMLTRLGQGGPVLDLGCGRGELAFQLAANGIPVTAIDYSPTAIEIAKGCFDEASAAAREKATFICGDATDLQLPTRFAVAIAGDLIEHLAPEELERLYASVADLLMPNGVFVIHTAPNVWRYTRSYPRRRREVRRLGGDMPAEPRTRYELLMHINEQSPTQLRRALRRYFPHVLVWVGTPRNPADHLTRRFSIGELAGALSIYALASHARIDAGEAAIALTSRPLPQGEHAKFRIALVECPDTVEAGSLFKAKVSLATDSSELLSSLGAAAVFISYHWCTLTQDEVVVFDGLRSAIPLSPRDGEKRVATATVQAPSTPGDFLLVMSLVQEGHCWFERMPGFIPAEKPVRVTPLSVAVLV